MLGTVTCNKQDNQPIIKIFSKMKKGTDHLISAEISPIVPQLLIQSHLTRDNSAEWSENFEVEKCWKESGGRLHFNLLNVGRKWCLRQVSILPSLNYDTIISVDTNFVSTSNNRIPWFVRNKKCKRMEYGHNLYLTIWIWGKGWLCHNLAEVSFQKQG